MRDTEAEFEKDMQGFCRIRLQNVGQRALHDTPFLRLFHSDSPLAIVTLGVLFPVCVPEWMSECVYLPGYKVQPVPPSL